MKKTIVASVLFTIVLFSAFPENLLSLYKGTEKYERLASKSCTTESEINLYRLGEKNRAFKIGTIRKNSSIEIMADTDRTDTYDKMVYYLVKIDGDEGLWSGWISSKDINIEIDVTYPRYMLSANNLNLSANNERAAFNVGNDGNDKWIIAERTGNILYKLETWVVRETRYDLSFDYIEFEGWSKNLDSVWFSCISIPDRVAFVSIEPDELFPFSIMDVPPHFGSTEYKINFDTKEVYYSDYYHAFDIDTAIMWNREGKQYSLYSYHFIKKDYYVVDRNKGEGFQITLDENGRFQYEKSDFYRIGTLNDSRVRIRKEPNLESETVGHLSKGQMVNIIDQTEETMQIGNMNSVWYRVYTEDSILGWAYGYFIDIIEE